MNTKLYELAAQPELALRCSEIDEPAVRNVKKPNYRNKFMSDRDRILYCKAFLRLSGKTQVYTPIAGDHQRTRLTHTLEVSQIARTISKTLCLDCDLTEAIALGHDIGHTPFGHAGERMLHEILSPTNDRDAQTPKTTSIFKLNSRSSQRAYEDLYGFKHNLQSVRFTVEDLESKSSKRGLDLTNYTLWGISHHSSFNYKEGHVSTNYIEPKFYNKYSKYFKTEDGKEAWSFEALVVAEADEIAQMHHDLEDAIRVKSISNRKVLGLVSRLQPLMSDEDKATLQAMINDERSKEYLIGNISKIVVNTLVTSLIEATRANFLTILSKRENRDYAYDIANDEILHSVSYDVYGQDKNVKLVRKFKSDMSNAVLYTHDVQRSDSKGKYIIKNLFEAYYTNPQQLPDNAMKNLYKSLKEEGYKFIIDEEYFRVDSSELRFAIEKAIQDIRSRKDIRNDICLMRVICDYIAGMTDKFAIEEYEKLYG